MSVKITVVKSEKNAFNAFLADDDKIGDQVQVTVTVDGKEISAMGNTKDEAIEAVREKVSDHYSAKKHIANLEINKAIGLNFFE